MAARELDTAPVPKAHADFERLRVKVEQVLVGGGKPRSLVDRLVPVIPYFEIEAWLYQNTRALRTAAEGCGEREREATVALANAWEADRRALDEVPRPKDATCVRDGANDVLARGYPAAEVFDVDASFARSVEALLEAPGFADLLGGE
jgi:hypothetical protein